MQGRKWGGKSDKFGGGEVYGGEEMGWGSDKYGGGEVYGGEEMGWGKAVRKCKEKVGFSEESGGREG